jgi:hypothetical protein
MSATYNPHGMKQILGCFALCLLLAACGRDEDALRRAEVHARLVGKWEKVSLETVHYKKNRPGWNGKSKTVFAPGDYDVFTASHRLTLNRGKVLDSLAYSLPGPTELSLRGYGDKPEVYTIRKLTSTRLVLENRQAGEHSGDRVVTLVYQKPAK